MVISNEGEKTMSVQSKIIEISPTLALIEANNKGFYPYSVNVETGKLSPIRGIDKNGKRVWRTYKTIEDAKINLAYI